MQAVEEPGLLIGEVAQSSTPANQALGLASQERRKLDHPVRLLKNQGEGGGGLFLHEDFNFFVVFFPVLSHTL